MTEVKFVKDKSGEFKGSITAVFPYEIATLKGEMTCYMYVGQHSACSVSWLNETVPAKPNEYADLYNELVAIGYDDLVIIEDIDPYKYEKALEPLKRDANRYFMSQMSKMLQELSDLKKDTNGRKNS